MCGHLVKTYNLSSYDAGEHTLEWNAKASGMNSGAYIYEIRTAEGRVTKSMVYIEQ